MMTDLQPVGPAVLHRLTSLQSGDRFGLGVVKMLAGGGSGRVRAADAMCVFFSDALLLADESFFFF